jgi:beta-phosphoglucomutase-like phosphatase (HAD superfamily)
VIEDSYTGVMASSKAGCFTVAVPNAFSLNHDFSGAHLLISSFNHYSVDQFLKDVEAIRGSTDLK